MLKLSHYLSLYTITKGVENLEYTKTLRVKELIRKNESQQNINAFKLKFDDEIKLYKNKAIREIINMHPIFYQDLLEYDDWDSAMRYLHKDGIEYINHFNKKGATDD